MDKFALIEENQVEEIVKIAKFASELELEILNLGSGEMKLNAFDVSRPGLQLCGFYNYTKGERIQVIGTTEHNFIKTLDPEVRTKRIREFFAKGMPCLIFSKSIIVEDYFIEYAEEFNLPLLRSHGNTTTLIHDLVNYLNELLAERTQVHGVLMEIMGVGVLIYGNSGVGKSEAALDLVKRGNRLISDDVVMIKRIGKHLIGTAPEIIRHFMEVRGIGIINIGTLYGAGAIKYVQEVEMVIELENWDGSKEYERIGSNLSYETILGIKLPKNTIPVTKGRNLANIIETAAMAMRMRYYGYNAAEEIEKRSNFNG